MIKRLKRIFGPLRRRWIQKTTKMNFYIFQGPTGKLPKNFHIGHAKQFADLPSIMKIRLSSEKKNLFTKRFMQKDILVWLTDGENVLSYGWIFGGDRFYLFEIDKTTCHRDNRFLYDFYTPENFRNKGYYTMLISNVPKLYPETKFTIAATQSNIASNKGIQNAGFILTRDIEFCK